MTDDKKIDVYENWKYLSLRQRSLHKMVFTILKEAVSDVVLPFSIKEIMKTRKKTALILMALSQQIWF